MKSKVHPTYKTKYRVANWPAYNRALVRRGDVTVWLSSDAIAAWTPGRSGRRGGQRRYSDLAIETALTLRLLYHLPLRQAEGFLHALFGMMRLDLSAPDYTTLSRRSQHLRRCLRPVPTDEGLHLVLDSTGLSLVGEGEWAAAKHGGRGRRGWRKLHLGVDQFGVIRVHTLTEETGDDATTALDLLTAVEGPVRLEFPILSLNPGSRQRCVASGLLQRGTQPRVVEGPHAVDLRRRKHGGPCRAEQCPLDLPLPGTWSSSQWRPDNEFETDRRFGPPFSSPQEPHYRDAVEGSSYV